MTPDKPDTQDLLRAAAEVMKKVLIPALPDENRLDALMVLSIMAGAERDLADNGGLAHRQAARLQKIMSDAGSVRDLCTAIRRGDFDRGESAQTLHALLMEDVRDRLTLVNPKYLEAADSDQSC
ncbi:MAG: DUF6285 domain-containing protein [Alphaproteobacteria bacterium]|nr:DUF6285 domain-containing protein [Alphaproteobacteria bacterium]